MNTIVTNFNSTNLVIKAAIDKLITIKPADAKDFRLSVTTVDDTKKEGSGQFAVEAPIVLSLIETAYWEIASILNKPEQGDHVPVADRRELAQLEKGASFIPSEDGGNEDSKQRRGAHTPDPLTVAITAAAMVKKYAEHIAAVKGGGAAWILEGFNTKRWVPTNPSDEEATLLCVDQSNDFSDLITAGRVKKVDTHVAGRMISFNNWCDAQRMKADQEANIKNMMAVAKMANIEIESVTTEVALKFMGSWAATTAENKDASRLTRAVRKVANQKYRALCWAIPNGKKNDIDYRMGASSWPLLQYSDLFRAELAQFKESDEYQNHELQVAVNAAKAKVAEERRQMIRESVMLDIEDQAADIELQRREMQAQKEANEARKAAIFAKLNPQVVAEAEAAEKAKQEKAEAAKAKAAATREANKAKKEAERLAKANTPTKGIAGKVSAFDQKPVRRRAA